MNIEKIKEVINYLLDNNLALVEKGLDKIAINIEGPAGVGKTSIIKQLAEQRGAGYKRLNLSELEEIGDLCGIPQKEYLMYSPEGEEKWVVEKVVNQFISSGYTLCPTCEPRMTYAVPEWVPKDPEQEFILFLDDYSRGSSLFMQAIMSLIQFGEYVSWKLPKRCHLICSSNPDDGSYSVSSLDAAQKSRLITLNTEFDVEVFAKWAETAGLRGEFINFALLNREIFDRSAIINARSYTLFANASSNLKDLSSVESLAMTDMLATGCFGEDGEYIGGLFVTFVHNKLDKLITPEDMLKKDWKDVTKSLEECIYRDGLYRADIASTLTIRFINYMDNYFSTKLSTSDSNKAIDRILEIVTYEGKVLLTEDLIFRLIVQLNSRKGGNTKFSKLLANPKVRAKIL